MKCRICDVDHRGLCHNCKHHADVMAGQYSGMQFSATPCSACSLNPEYSVSGHGRIAPLHDNYEAQAQEPSDDSGRDLDRFSHFLAALWQHTIITREVIVCRLLGQTYADIAARLSATIGRTISPQVCHFRLKSALRRDGNVRELFGEMVTKQKRRARNAGKDDGR